MLGVSLRDHNGNQTLRQMGGVRGTVAVARESKIRLQDTLLALLTTCGRRETPTEWCLPERKQPL